MSRTYRRSNTLPANQFSRFVWLLEALWEEIHDLFEIYHMLEVDNHKYVLSRHILVDFDTLDELVKELHMHNKNHVYKKLNTEDRKLLEQAFSKYHRTVEPSRNLIKSIRDNLGAHRTGMPVTKSKKSGIKDPKQWGKWEQLLVELEKKCKLDNWIDVINAFVPLMNVIRNLNIDEWYSFTENGEFRYFVPIQAPKIIKSYNSGNST